MDVGLILPRVDPGDQPLTGDHFVASMRRIEDFGFHSVWITDSIGRGFPNPEPLIALGAAAVVTEYLRLGTSILQVAIRNPVDLAHRVMTTHLLAGDRLLLGVGAGSTQADFSATGSTFENRFARFEAALETMRALWRGETVEGTCLEPFPGTLGGPDLVIGSWGGSKWIPRAAQEFDGWIGSARKTNWNVVEKGIRRYRDAGGEQAIMTNIVIDPHASNDADQDDAPLDPCGPKTGLERLRRFRDLGFDEVVLRTWDHTDECVGTIAELAVEVSELRV